MLFKIATWSALKMLLSKILDAVGIQRVQAGRLSGGPMVFAVSGK